MLDESSSFVAILAPNFEDRSLAVAEDICIHKNEKTNRLILGVITLQGKEEYDARDLIKARNCNRCVRNLELAGFTLGANLHHQSLENPIVEADLRQLFTTLEKGIGEYNLVIDVSGLPRTFLWRLLDYVDNGELHTRPGSRAQQIYLIYNWAESYSDLLEHESVGEVVDHVRQEPIADVISRYSSADVVLFGSGSTQSAFHVLGTVKKNAPVRDVELEFISFLRPNRFGLFWDSAIRQQELFSSTTLQDRVSKSFVFDEEHALYWLRDLASRSLDRLSDRKDHLFAIVPGGPKIISIISQFVVSEYLRKIELDFDFGKIGSGEEVTKRRYAAVGGHGRGQYLSLYSFGVSGEFSCLEVTNEA
ncbi:hypothetical protein [Ruegeria sp. EL01]|uniref:hypothetical protein n=1 Tax=Ruegeria sp. EL01 TaxID=2107578 RepID=UPI000EA80BDC|nr:hypothetical protein [Ruegeria sp. EL01]